MCLFGLRPLIGRNGGRCWRYGGHATFAATYTYTHRSLEVVIFNDTARVLRGVGVVTGSLSLNLATIFSSLSCGNNSLYRLAIANRLLVGFSSFQFHGLSLFLFHFSRPFLGHLRIQINISTSYESFPVRLLFYA